MEPYPEGTVWVGTVRPLEPHHRKQLLFRILAVPGPRENFYISDAFHVAHMFRWNPTRWNLIDAYPAGVHPLIWQLAVLKGSWDGEVQIPGGLGLEERHVDPPG